MNAPFFELGLLGERSALWIALGIGIAFGFCLERAGLGSARKLVGQFYGTDFTVFKVMFSAIVTAMLGAFWLGRAGLLDLSRVYVPETWLLPQLTGGAIFGAGLAIGGLCPGTSCVAAATGRGDGLALVLGMFSGVIGTGLTFGPLRALYEATPRGSLTLPQLLHLPYGVVILLVVGVALGGFRFVEWLEGRRIAPRAVELPRDAARGVFAFVPRIGSRSR